MEKLEKILTKIAKILINILHILLIIIALVLIYNIIQLKIFNKPYMNVFGYSVFQVKTGSMSGTLEEDDIIVVKITKDVKENDIITFVKDEVIITHRITKIEGDQIITQGDANNSEDKSITTNDIIGKVTFTFKNIAIWKKVLMTPQVYILIVMTLVLLGTSKSIKDKVKK